jgi:hypothetical protein
MTNSPRGGYFGSPDYETRIADLALGDDGKIHVAYNAVVLSGDRLYYDVYNPIAGSWSLVEILSDHYDSSKFVILNQNRIKKIKISLCPNPNLGGKI